MQPTSTPEGHRISCIIMEHSHPGTFLDAEGNSYRAEIGAVLEDDSSEWGKQISIQSNYLIIIIVYSSYRTSDRSKRRCDSALKQVCFLYCRPCDSMSGI